MKTLKITGWEEYQTFRKDRGAPPWIKVYRTLLTSEKWSFLTDAEKGQLISIWLPLEAGFALPSYNAFFHFRFKEPISQDKSHEKHHIICIDFVGCGKVPGVLH